MRRYSFRDLWRMVARSAFVQLGYRYWSVPLVMLGLAFFFAGPSAIVVASVAAVALGVAAPATWLAFALAALARILETGAILPWVRHHRIRHAIGWSLTFPLAALLYGAMTVGLGLGPLCAAAGRHGRDAAMREREGAAQRRWSVPDTFTAQP